MVFSAKGISIEKTMIALILGLVLILALTALLPTVVSNLITMTETIFNGTAFADIFSGGLIVYGVVAIAIVLLVFKLFGMKGKA